MVVDVPTYADFEQESLGSLNLAFDIAYELMSQVEEAEMDTWDDDGSITDEYWRSAQRPLGNALTLIQQSHELGLKGKIVAFSPYILIAQDVRQWPTAAQGGVPFSKFRTLDAVDLPKVYDLFSVQPLSDEFKILYEDVRQRRNTISHSISKGDRLTCIDLLKAILKTFVSIHSTRRWPEERLKYLFSLPVTLAYPNDQVYAIHLLELESLLQKLTKSEQK